MKYLFYLCILLFYFSCKKENINAPVVGHWQHVLTKTHTSSTGPYPTAVWDSYGYETITDDYEINLEKNGKIQLLKNGLAILDDDAFVDDLGNSKYQIHYYGNRKSQSTDRFTVQIANDTLFIRGFFPYQNYSQHFPGGHGGIGISYSYTNYFVRQ